MQVLVDFALRQHPPGPAGPEEFEGVKIYSRDVGTALSRHIIKGIRKPGTDIIRSASSRAGEPGIERPRCRTRPSLSFRALQTSGFLASAWALMMETRGDDANNNFAVENLAIAA